MLKLNFKIQKSETHGFTLIELLVAITIVAIISVLGFGTYEQAQLLGRDSRRKQDIASIKVALELYRQQNGHYPCTTTNSDSFTSSGDYQTSSTTGFWISDNSSCYTSPATPTPFNTSYINQMPHDPAADNGNPITTSTTTFGYAYWSGKTTDTGCPSGTAQYYILGVELENSSDSNVNGNPGKYLYCDGKTVISSNKNVYIVTSQ